MVAASQLGSPAFSSNLIDADNPDSRAMNIAGIPRPSTPSSQESLHSDTSGGDEVEESGDDEPRKFWPCICGAEVPLAVGTCPACGSAFLSELRGMDDPKRSGSSLVSAYLDASRPVRLAIAGTFAFVVAAGVPGILMLFD
jgi:hypothetical protein